MRFKAIIALVLTTISNLTLAAGTHGFVEQAPFIIMDRESGTELRSMTGRYKITEFTMIDTFNGRQINTYQDLIRAKKYIDFEKIGEGSGNVDTRLMSSLEVISRDDTDEMDLIAFVDPFDQVSFDFLTALMKHRQKHSINYQLVLMSKTKDSSNYLRFFYCALQKGGEKALENFVSGTAIADECTDLYAYMNGLQIGYLVTAGVIPMAVNKHKIAYTGPDLMNIDYVIAEPKP